MNDTLFTIAELSLALAGFSGIVVGFHGSRTGGLTAQDRFGLMHILSGSGMAMVFSLLPSVIHAAGLDAATAERIASTALGLLILVLAPTWGLLTRHTPPRYPRTYWAFVSSGLLLGAALLATSSGLVHIAGTLLPLALLWLLLLAFAQFAAFLALLWPSKE